MRLPTLLHRMVVAAPRSPITHVVGSVLQLSAQMAQVMLIAHMFGAGVVGIYGYSLALITPMVLLANWHVRHALVMDGSRRFAWSAYARLRGFSFLAAVPILVSGKLPLIAPCRVTSVGTFRNATPLGLAMRSPLIAVGPLNLAL